MSVFHLYFANNATAEKMHNAVSLEQMVGQMILVGFRGVDEATVSPMLLNSIAKGEVGGVILFEYDVVLKSNIRNIQSLKQIKELNTLLQKHAPIPLFISTDQEGGQVLRIAKKHGADFNLPSAKSMSKYSAETTYTWGEKTGELLQSVGINLDFAPSVDVHINPQNPVIAQKARAFSANVDEVVKHAKAFATGLSKHNVIAAYKHFPGHGSSLTDTHVGMTDITNTWNSKELTPYLPANRPNVPLVIMSGHLFLKNMDQEYPATLSKNIITKLLRQDLAWDGVIVSDDMQMHALTLHYSRKEAIRLAILAGVDILVAGNNLEYEENIGQTMHQDIMSLITAGQISQERITQSYKRIINLKKEIGLIKAGL